MLGGVLSNLGDRLGSRVGKARLSLFNMVLWNVLIVLGIPQLSSGRAAILGYTMPIFSAAIGAM